MPTTGENYGWRDVGEVVNHDARILSANATCEVSIFCCRWARRSPEMFPITDKFCPKIVSPHSEPALSKPQSAAVCQAPHRSKPEINGAGSQLAHLQVASVTHHHGPVEHQGGSEQHQSANSSGACLTPGSESKFVRLLLNAVTPAEARGSYEPQ